MVLQTQRILACAHPNTREGKNVRSEAKQINGLTRLLSKRRRRHLWESRAANEKAG